LFSGLVSASPYFYDNLYHGFGIAGKNLACTVHRSLMPALISACFYDCTKSDDRVDRPNWYCCNRRLYANMHCA